MKHNRLSSLLRFVILKTSGAKLGAGVGKSARAVTPRSGEMFIDARVLFNKLIAVTEMLSISLTATNLESVFLL